MAYRTSNPPQRISRNSDGSRPHVWSYIDNDPLATVLAPGYFADADNLGMRKRDIILYADSSNDYAAATLTVSGISDGAATVKGAVSASSGSTSFTTRAAAVTWMAANDVPDGFVAFVGNLAYVASTGATAIADMPGWVPVNTPTALHWGADNTGATNAIPAVSAMVDYLQSIGGGRGIIPAGTYLWVGSMAFHAYDKIILEGEGNATKLVRTGNRTAAAIRFYGGSNNRVRHIKIDCAGYAGRGFYLGDMYSGIEDCECINCPDRPFGLNGGSNTVYGLDSEGRTSEEAGFTSATFFPVGCFITQSRSDRSGNTAFSQKQMPYSSITFNTALNTYSEAFTIDKCDYSVVSGNVAIDCALVDTQQFPDLDAGSGYLTAGGGGVGGVGIDGSDGARFIGNTILGVQTTTATRNDRTKAAINFVNNIGAAFTCTVSGSHIADAKCGIYVKDIAAGAAGENFRHLLGPNTFEDIGTAAGSGSAFFGAVWIEAGAGNLQVAGNSQRGGSMLITDLTANSWVENPDETTFTPVLKFGGASTGITYAASGQRGRFQRQGRLITFAINIVLTSKGSATGGLTISGLPAVCDANAITMFGGILFNNPGASGVAQPFGQIVGGTSEITLYNDRSLAAAVTQLDDTNVTDTTSIVIQGSYEV